VCRRLDPRGHRQMREERSVVESSTLSSNARTTRDEGGGVSWDEKCHGIRDEGGGSALYHNAVMECGPELPQKSV
jgi:hypothetical protein